MGDINGGPGYGAGGYGGGPQWNPYGRGPQQPRGFMPGPGGGWAGGVNPRGRMQEGGGGQNIDTLPVSPAEIAFRNSFQQNPWGAMPQGGWGGGSGRPQEGYGSWGGGGSDPWGSGGWGTQFMQQMQRPLANWQQGNQPAQGGFQNAPGLYQQYQGMQPGADRDALVRQMQGSDNGAAYRASMRDAGYQLNQGPGGSFSYAAAPGMAPPGSLSAAQQALSRGDPNAQSMLNQAAGLPVQSGRDYGLDAMKNFASQQNGPQAPRDADSVAGQGGPPPQTGTYSSQGPPPWNPYGYGNYGQRSWRGMQGQGPGGYGYARGPNNPWGGMQNGAPK